MRYDVNNGIKNANENLAKKRHLGATFVKPVPGEIYFGHIMDADALVDEKKRERVDLDMKGFTTPWGSDFTVSFYPFGTGAKYYDIMLATLGISNYVDAIGKIVRFKVEENGMFINFIIFEEATSEELEEEIVRLEKKATMEGWRCPKNVSRNEKGNPTTGTVIENLKSEDNGNKPISAQDMDNLDDM